MIETIYKVNGKEFTTKEEAENYEKSLNSKEEVTVVLKEVINQIVSSVNLSEVREAEDLVDLVTKIYCEKFEDKILKNKDNKIIKEFLIWKSVEEVFKKFISKRYAHLALSETQIEKLIKLSYIDFGFSPEFSYDSFDFFKDLIKAIEIYRNNED